MTNNNENPAPLPSPAEETPSIRVGDRVLIPGAPLTPAGNRPTGVVRQIAILSGDRGASAFVVSEATREGSWYAAADLVVAACLSTHYAGGRAARLGASGAWDSWVTAAQATPAQVSGGGGVRGANASTAGAGGGVAWVSAVGGLAVGPGPAGAAVAFGAATPDGVAVVPVPTDAQVDAMAEAARAYAAGLGAFPRGSLVDVWLVALRALLDAGWFPGAYLRAAVGAGAIPSPAMIEAARAAASEVWRTAARQGAVTDFEGAIRAAVRAGVARLLADGWRP